MPNVILADDRYIVQCDDCSLYMLGDDSSRVSHHILISVVPTERSIGEPLGQSPRFEIRAERAFG